MPEPQYHPITMLPLVSELIEGSLADAREILGTFEEARPNPHVLDDDTVQRAVAYHTEGLEFVDVYAEQLRRWAASALTAAQTREVARLQAMIEPLRQVHTDGLALARELAGGTIEQVMGRPVAALAVEAVRGARRKGRG